MDMSVIDIDITAVSTFYLFDFGVLPAVCFAFHFKTRYKTVQNLDIIVLINNVKTL